VRLSGQSGLKSVDAHYVDVVVDFLRTYADRCHHGKEEDILFRQLGEKDLEADLSATMRRLLAEHEWARTTTRSLVVANVSFVQGVRGAEADVRRLLGELAAFYPRHIELEDDHFFRPVMDYFSEEEKQEMLEAFTVFDASLIHEQYRAVAEQLQGG